MNKQEALDALELYHRNMEHILGPEDEKVKTIETCIQLVEEIEDLPSTQPEIKGYVDENGHIKFGLTEVIRCKDCKYSSPNKVYGCRLERFDTWEDGPRMYSNDFCSLAERKEE